MALKGAGIRCAAPCRVGLSVKPRWCWQREQRFQPRCVGLEFEQRGVELEPELRRCPNILTRIAAMWVNDTLLA